MVSRFPFPPAREHIENRSGQELNSLYTVSAKAVSTLTHTSETHWGKLLIPGADSYAETGAAPAATEPARHAVHVGNSAIEFISRHLRSKPLRPGGRSDSLLEDFFSMRRLAATAWISGPPDSKSQFSARDVH